MGKIATIAIELAPRYDGGLAVWDITVMTSGIGIRYVVPDPVGLGPLHAARAVLTHHLAPNDGCTVSGFTALPKAQDTP